MFGSQCFYIATNEDGKENEGMLCARWALTHCSKLQSRVRALDESSFVHMHLCACTVGM